MPDTFTLIASSTVGAGGAASIDFTSIPSTYTDLCAKLSLRGNNGNIYASILVRLNSDTGSNYTYKALQGDGATAGSYGATGTTSFIGNGVGASSTASTFSNIEFYIPNYSSSAQKSFSSDGVSENNATTAYTNLIGNLWTGTAAISSISITNQQGNFVQYSTAYLYGVKNA